MHELMKLLGLKVKDKVTGFEGVVTSICLDLYGCKQALLHPGLDKEGKFKEQAWFDITRLTVMDHIPVMAVPNVDKGPAEKPQSRAV